MEILKIIGGIVALSLICAVIASPFMLETHGREKFGYSFFSKLNCGVGVVASMPFWLGHFWLNFGIEHHDVSAKQHALAFMAFGIAVSGYILYRNIKFTTLWYGLGVSVIQIPVLLYFCVFVVPAMFILGFITASGTDSQESAKPMFGSGQNLRGSGARECMRHD